MKRESHVLLAVGVSNVAQDGSLAVLDAEANKIVVRGADGGTRELLLSEEIEAASSIGLGPDGKHLYVGNWYGQLFELDTDGTLLGDMYVSDNDPVRVDLAQAGEVYASTGNEAIYRYAPLEDRP